MIRYHIKEMKCQFISIVLVMLFAWNGSSYAEKSKTVTMGVIGFPPLTLIKSGTNECYGPAIDVTRNILDKAGYKLEIVCAPAARIYKMMSQGSVDITINVKSTRLLAPHTTFIEPLFTTLNLQLYIYDKEMPLSIAGIRSFDYLGYRQKLGEDGYTFSDLATADDAIAMFIRGRTKALITYERPISNYLKQNLNNELPEGVSVTNLQSIGTYYGISKQSPNHDELIRLLSTHAIENKLDTFYQVVQ